MGIGMLGGILSGLGDIILGLISDIVGLLFKFLIAPFLLIVGEILKTVLSYYFYLIGAFILKLVDFIEILFRALAGLPTEDLTLTFTDGASNLEGSSDLLLQLIRSDGVQTAFLSMCIVGLFLLIITTIFQMIKVEYTTEGAKNAKGPILEKAFKGLANLVMLPLLVVFGVFIGNQVLGLLDTATKGDENYKISGLIFATAASDAFYREGDQFWLLDDNGVATALIGNIGPLVRKVVKDVVEIYDNKDATRKIENPDFQKDEDERKAILDKYKTGDPNGEWGVMENLNLSRCVYSNLSRVSFDFDISSINYVVMCVGGIFVLKSLYLACFGMISRLYTCTILFIISPAVIGMSPINEGNLGKWRGRFIGSCLSAYGVILSLNLFFIIVDVLLSIEPEFNGFFPGFSNIFMKGLLQTLLVIAGITMIEKFSKELGSYFGAEDAISAGKELEGAMAAPVKAAVGVAAAAGGMAVGAGGLALKAGKGIASKVTGGKSESGLNAFNKARAEGLSLKDSIAKGKQGWKDNEVGKEKAKKEQNKKDAKFRAENYNANKATLNAYDQEMQGHDDNINKQKELLQQERDKLKTAKGGHRATIEAQIKSREANVRHAENAKTEAQEKYKDANIDKIRDDVGLHEKDVEKQEKDKAEKRMARRSNIDNISMIAKGSIFNLAKGTINDANPSQLGGNVWKQISGAVKETEKLSDEYGAAYKGTKKKIDDTREKAIDGLSGAEIDRKNKTQQMIIANAIVDQMQVKDRQDESRARDMVQQYNEVQNGIGAYAGMGPEQRQRISADLAKALDDMGAKVKVSADGNMHFEKMNNKMDYDAIKKAIAAGMVAGIPAGKMADKIIEAIAADGTRSQREMDRIVEAINKVVNKIQ